ncbi:uncharacterized protein LOC108865177 [Galendromus occidentalis]|uniref:Uncharacterized protein LOC108865177 n=1 Tax=Galendromus occidentalis TaxID=34638 RepID=A0AAJ7PB12_9ACAR|nr:uncharacterized protein LOC108865177 [Galendromus occidentalis]
MSENAANFCGKVVKVTLGCGHSCSAPCNVSRDEAYLSKKALECKESIFVEGPCKHLVKIPCGKREDRHFITSCCKVPVEAMSPCGHFVKVVCSSSNNSGFVVSLCNIGNELKLNCGHSMRVPCSESRQLEEISRTCEVKVQNVLSCQHTVEQSCQGTRGKPDEKCIEVGMQQNTPLRPPMQKDMRPTLWSL